MTSSSTKFNSTTSRSTRFAEKTMTSVITTTTPISDIQTPSGIPTVTPTALANTSKTDILNSLIDLWSKPVVRISIYAGGSLIILSIILCVALCYIGEPQTFEYANHLARYDTTSRRMKYEDTIVNQEIPHSESDYLDYDRTSDIFEHTEHFSREIPDNDLMDLHSVTTDDSLSGDYIHQYGANRDSLYSEISSWQSPRISHHEQSRSSAIDKKTFSITSKKDLYVLRESRKGLSEF
ncbi:hypothetical protein HK103_002542 [Boothiomyces macroporosus]|uniref:Uncharacterized protein n=1 Tax=Boothiomyces macroporosus TaxID=261099 RepID=A0AAD5UN74_9FUNG|nr:hypothetical protein HK103_002542 [Boothiomyces macroporosus]